MEDIPLLVEYFINKFNKIRGKWIQGIDQQVLKTLMYHDFPGNIRELENIMEHAFVLCSEGNIKMDHMPCFLSSPANEAHGDFTENDPVKSAEIKVIMDALKRNHYNRKAAAAEIGMHKSTLFRKIHKLGIRLPEGDGRSERTRTPS